MRQIAGKLVHAAELEKRFATHLLVKGVAHMENAVNDAVAGGLVVMILFLRGGKGMRHFPIAVSVEAFENCLALCKEVGERRKT
jgi:hypothetical protein